MNTLGKAIEIAVIVHNGQLDRGGKPYIAHPLRTMLYLDDIKKPLAPTEDERIVAILHDAFEDGGAKGFEMVRSLVSSPALGREVFPALDALTRKKSESYDDYILGILRHPIAVRAKLADIMDNTDPERIKCLDEAQAMMLRAKYLKARKALLRRYTVVNEVISGGQTGVDRAGLDAAISAGIPHGGGCPAHRKAEDGTIPPIYNMQEINTTSYSARTMENVKKADMTVIFYDKNISGGTKQTWAYALEYNRPVLKLDVSKDDSISLVSSFVQWIRQFDKPVNQDLILNVAGPRESKCLGIYAKSKKLLDMAFDRLKAEECSKDRLEMSEEGTKHDLH